MYTSIVVPLDGSEFGNLALPVAMTLARRSNASLHLVHVRAPILFPEGGPAYSTRIDEDARIALTEVASRLGQDRSVTIHMEFMDGPVIASLMRYCGEGSHELVVMMTHGRGGVSRAWLGSVADGLVRDAPAPLLLLRQETAWLNRGIEPLFRRILVPLDGSGSADAVVDHVTSLATPDATSYVLLTILEPQSEGQASQPDGNSATSPGDTRQRHAARDYLAGVADDLRRSGAIVDTRVQANRHIAQGILALADAEGADLIALTTHGRGSISRLIHGSVADKLIRAAAVPVFVYRPEHLGAERMSASATAVRALY